MDAAQQGTPNAPKVLVAMVPEEPLCEIERDENGDVFVLVDGMKIAKRGAHDTAQANTWTKVSPRSRATRRRACGCLGQDGALRAGRAWLADQPEHRFEFTFTPTHGSWLNLVEGFFSKLARSVLRHIRVASKQELKDRIMAAMDYFNQDPVVHTWTYKLDKAA
jgi:hypothetical protein